MLGRNAASDASSRRGQVINRRRLVALALVLALAVPLVPQVTVAEGPVDTTFAQAPASPTEATIGANSVIEIPVVKTTFVASGLPDTNFGNSDTVSIGYDAGVNKAMRILFQLDLTSIPAGSVINWAAIRVYESSRTPANDGLMGFRAQMMTQPWDQNQVTWNNANYLGGVNSDLGSPQPTSGWVSFDITNAVRAWVGGAYPNYGVIVTGDETPSANRSRTYYTARYGTLVPVLTVDYTSGCTNPTPVATVNPLPQFSPGSFTVSWSLVPTAPGSCDPGPVSYYEVQYYQNGIWNEWLRTGATSATFSGASHGSVIQFRARAVDQRGNAQPFGGAQASTQVDSVPPTATVSPLPQFTTSQSFLVSWSGVDDGSGIAYYDVTFEQDGPVWQELLSRTTATSYQITGAQNGVHYSFRCRAVDRAGNVQPWSVAAQASTRIALYPVANVKPFVPAVLKPGASATDTFVVAWESTGVAGVANTNYALYYNYNGQGWKLWSNFPGIQTSASFDWKSTGHGDGPYSFEAVATNALGVTEQRKGAAEATIIVDMANLIRTQAYLPLVSRVTVQ